MRVRSPALIPLALSLLVALTAPRAVAAALTSVGFAREGASILVRIAVEGTGAYEVAARPDGLVFVIRLAEVDRLPPLPILDTEGAGLAAGVLERDGPRGARITLLAREPLTLADDARGADGLITIRLRPVAARREPVRLSPPPRLEPVRLDPTPPPPRGPEPRRARAEPAAPGARPAETPAPTPAPAPPAQTPSAQAQAPPAPAPPVSAPSGPAVSAFPTPAGMDRDDPLYRAALKGDQGAQVEIGTRCLGASPPDMLCARKWFQVAAERGNTIAAFNMGQMARRGVGMEVDDAEALRWYRIAAEQGLVQAQFNLALLMIKTRRGEGEVAAIRKWLRAAADQNFEPARRTLEDLDRILAETPPRAAPGRP